MKPIDRILVEIGRVALVTLAFGFLVFLPAIFSVTFIVSHLVVIAYGMWIAVLTKTGSVKRSNTMAFYLMAPFALHIVYLGIAISVSTSFQLPIREPSSWVALVFSTAALVWIMFVGVPWFLEQKNSKEKSPDDIGMGEWEK